MGVWHLNLEGALFGVLILLGCVVYCLCKIHGRIGDLIDKVGAIPDDWDFHREQQIKEAEDISRFK